MKFSSPKGDQKGKEAEQPGFLFPSTMKTDFMLPREKNGSWRQVANHYAPEAISLVKAFSPIITPLRKRNVMEGESVWRTPNSRHVASAERHPIMANTPDGQLYK
jgi:hypothetical protein